MRIYLDTEFNGHGGELISIALVDENGQDFYGVCEQRPDFQSLAGEFRAEGHQHIFAKPIVSPLREAAE